MNVIDTVLDELEGTTMPAKKSAAKKTAAAKKADTRVKVRTSALPPLDPSMMNDILLAVHDKSREIDEHRRVLNEMIGECDDLVKEAVDDGERYRDIAAAAGRTVPWVQMSLRRVAGVGTHPAEPIPETLRRRKAS
jgi:hypothetical protein